MENIVAVVVFGALLAIALLGLAVSNRQARLNNASRHAGGSAGGSTVHPHDQRVIARPGALRDDLSRNNI